MSKPLSDQCIINIEVNISHIISSIYSLWSPVCITLRTCFKYSAVMSGTAGLGGFHLGVVEGPSIHRKMSFIFNNVSFCSCSWLPANPPLFYIPNVFVVIPLSAFVLWIWFLSHAIKAGRDREGILFKWWHVCQIADVKSAQLNL